MSVHLPDLLAVAAWGSLAGAGVVAWLDLRPGAVTRPRLRWLWWGALGLALFCFRWPLISLPYELYPDETQLLTGAMTLRHDPLFWRALNMGTAGPLDCYILLPAAWFPGTGAYLVARMIGAFLAWATLAAAGEALVAATGLACTRLAAWPAFLFLMFTTSPEYIHHSTELVANLLVALAVLAGAWQLRRPRRRNLWLAGLLLGAVPWAKLQLVPLAAGLGLLLLAQEYAAGRRREIPTVIAMALLPTLLVFLVLALSGQTEHMLIPYVLENLLYVHTGRQSLALVALQQWDQATTNGYLAAWFAGALLFCTLTAARWRGHDSQSGQRKLLVSAGLLLGLAFVCILTPGRPYPHYLVLLLTPATLLIGWALALTKASPAGSRIPAGLLLFLVTLVAPSLLLRLSARPDPYAYYNLVQCQPSSGHHELVAKLRSLARPGEALGLWGWRSSLYVEAGLRQATRETHPLLLTIDGPYQGFFLRTYYEKFVENAPPVFVDATGPGNFYFTDRRQGHELFPRLSDWVRDHYTLVAELDGARVYARNDRIAPR